MRTPTLTLARTLVSERLAACVNVLPPMPSIYRWEGSVEEVTEHQLIIKTIGHRLDALKRRLNELHPYDVPELSRARRRRRRHGSIWNGSGKHGLAASDRRSPDTGPNPERLVDVLLEILDVLDADRDADHPVGDADGRRGGRAAPRRGS